MNRMKSEMTLGQYADQQHDNLFSKYRASPDNPSGGYQLFKIGDTVEHIRTGTRGTVIDVSGPLWAPNGDFDDVARAGFYNYKVDFGTEQGSFKDHEIKKVSESMKMRNESQAEDLTDELVDVLNQDPKIAIAIKLGRVEIGVTTIGGRELKIKVYQQTGGMEVIASTLEGNYIFTKIVNNVSELEGLVDSLMYKSESRRNGESMNIVENIPTEVLTSVMNEFEGKYEVLNIDSGSMKVKFTESRDAIRMAKLTGQRVVESYKPRYEDSDLESFVSKLADLLNNIPELTANKVGIAEIYVSNINGSNFSVKATQENTGIEVSVVNRSTLDGTYLQTVSKASELVHGFQRDILLHALGLGLPSNESFRKRYYVESNGRKIQLRSSNYNSAVHESIAKGYGRNVKSRMNEDGEYLVIETDTGNILSREDSEKDADRIASTSGGNVTYIHSSELEEFKKRNGLSESHRRTRIGKYESGFGPYDYTASDDEIWIVVNGDNDKAYDTEYYLQSEAEERARSLKSIGIHAVAIRKSELEEFRARHTVGFGFGESLAKKQLLMRTR